MDLVGIICNSGRRAEVVRKLMAYAQKKTKDEIRRELAIHDKETKKTISANIRKHGIELLVLKAASGISAQEQIHAFSSKDIAGYHSLRGLASAINGKPLATVSETGEYIVDLAKTHSLPELTNENQDYVREFNLDYVRKKTRMELKKKIKIGYGYNMRNSFFLKALSEKLQQDRKLQFEFFKKYTGINKPEEVTCNGCKKLPGYSSLTALARLLSGKRKTIQEAGHYFRQLVEEYT